MSATVQPSLSDSVSVLIKKYREAKAHHHAVFVENDHGRASDEQVAAALGPIDDALEAICRARPVDPAEQQLRAEFVSTELYAAIEGCHGLIQACLKALVAPDGEVSRRDAA